MRSLAVLPLPVAPPVPALRPRPFPSCHLQRILGGVWLLDGLLQLQPSMFTQYLPQGVMQGATEGQPEPLAAALHLLIHVVAQNIVLFNAAIAAMQIALGLALLLGWRVRRALVASVLWSIAVWSGGEGLGMLLTGKASVLTGAPGPVLLYALLAVAAYPSSGATSPLPRRRLRRYLAGFWVLAAVLQMQPAWWQPGEIARTIAMNESPGTLNGALLDPSLHWLTRLAGPVEVPLNTAFILAALVLATGLALVRDDHVHPLLISSAVLSALLWWATQGCGLLLTGQATDVNSGPLLVALAIACWPPTRRTDGGDWITRQRGDAATSINRHGYHDA